MLDEGLINTLLTRILEIGFIQQNHLYSHVRKCNVLRRQSVDLPVAILACACS